MTHVTRTKSANGTEVWSSIINTATSRVLPWTEYSKRNRKQWLIDMGLYKPNDTSNFEPRQVWQDMIEVNRLRSSKASPKGKTR
jgi:hypothetical protein